MANSRQNFAKKKNTDVAVGFSHGIVDRVVKVLYFGQMPEFFE